MTELLKNRYEVVFAYDVKDGNPNGDPMDENKPRMDEQLGINLVSDVRLKRTIRDELQEQGETIFVSGEVISSQKRAEQILEEAGLKKYETKEQALQVLTQSCLDLRLFGGTIPLKLSGKGNAGEGVSLTGPVQFRMGRSVHKVSPVFMQGTAAFISKESAAQRSFREEWILPYSLILFYGVINQNAAQKTALTEEDVNKLFHAMWNGTKNLITRSKMEQVPRLLLAVKYKESQNLHIGELDKYIQAKSEQPDEEIRDITQVQLELASFKAILDKYQKQIDTVYYRLDDRTLLTDNGRPINDLGQFLGSIAAPFTF